MVEGITAFQGSAAKLVLPYHVAKIDHHSCALEIEAAGRFVGIKGVWMHHQPITSGRETGCPATAAIGITGSWPAVLVDTVVTVVAEWNTLRLPDYRCGELAYG